MSQFKLQSPLTVSQARRIAPLRPSDELLLTAILYGYCPYPDERPGVTGFTVAGAWTMTLGI